MGNKPTAAAYRLKSLIFIKAVNLWLTGRTKSAVVAT
jgi:hypothetical protein